MLEAVGAGCAATFHVDANTRSGAYVARFMATLVRCFVGVGKRYRVQECEKGHTPNVDDKDEKKRGLSQRRRRGGVRGKVLYPC